MNDSQLLGGLAVFVNSPSQKWPQSVYEVTPTVDEAIDGYGRPEDRAEVLALEVQKLRAALDEARKMRAICIRNMAEGAYPPNDRTDAQPTP